MDSDPNQRPSVRKKMEELKAQQAQREKGQPQREKALPFFTMPRTAKKQKEDWNDETYLLHPVCHDAASLRSYDHRICGSSAYRNAPGSGGGNTASPATEG